MINYQFFKKLIILVYESKILILLCLNVQTVAKIRIYGVCLL